MSMQDDSRQSFLFYLGRACANKVLGVVTLDQNLRLAVHVTYCLRLKLSHNNLDLVTHAQGDRYIYMYYNTSKYLAEICASRSMSVDGVKVLDVRLRAG
jgi:hypothetical protein